MSLSIIVAHNEERLIGVGPVIPWHISRFHADYKFDKYPSTPESTLKAAYDLAQAQDLRYIYSGNVAGWGEDTFCSKCKRMLIKREGFDIVESHLSGNKCLFCQATLPGLII